MVRASFVHQSYVFFREFLEAFRAPRSSFRALGGGVRPKEGPTGDQVGTDYGPIGTLKYSKIIKKTKALMFLRKTLSLSKSLQKTNSRSWKIYPICSQKWTLRRLLNT